MLYVDDIIYILITVFTSLVAIVVKFFVKIAMAGMGLVFGLGFGYVLFYFSGDNIIHLFNLFNVEMDKFNFILLIGLINGIAGFISDGFTFPRVQLMDTQIFEEEEE